MMGQGDLLVKVCRQVSKGHSHKPRNWLYLSCSNQLNGSSRSRRHSQKNDLNFLEDSCVKSSEKQFSLLKVQTKDGARHTHVDDPALVLCNKSKTMEMKTYLSQYSSGVRLFFWSANFSSYLNNAKRRAPHVLLSSPSVFNDSSHNFSLTPKAFLFHTDSNLASEEDISQDSEFSKPKRDRRMPPEVKLYRKQQRYERRLKVLAEYLECDQATVLKMIEKHPPIGSVNIEIAKKKIEVLKGMGITMPFVQAHPRVIDMMGSKTILRRLELFENNNVLSQKSVLTDSRLADYIEARHERFEKAFEKVCAKVASLEGCADKVDYLQFRLGISEEEATKIHNNVLLPRSVTELRLKHHIDFLLNEAELPPDFVAKNLRLCRFSLENLRSRMKIVVDAGAAQTPQQLVVFWNMSKVNFDKFFDLCDS